MSHDNVKNILSVIDLEYLQGLQDCLGRMSGITTVLLDADGNELSRPTNRRAFCEMMINSPESSHSCAEAHKLLIAENIKTRKHATLTCPNSGLRAATIPIFLGEQLIGVWLIGQVKIDNVNWDDVSDAARKAGISEYAVRRNLSMLPSVTEEEFLNAIDYYSTIARTLTDMVEINAKLESRNEELLKLTNQLDSSLRTFREFINLSDSGTYLVDYHTGEIIVCNSAYTQLFGLNDVDVNGKLCYVHMQNDEFCEFCPKPFLLDESGEPTGPYVWENYNAVVDKWLNISSRALRWIDGRMAIMTTFIDITDRKKEEERIAYLAYNDQYLDIPNSFKLIIDQKEKCAEDTYLILFDLKGLKEINNVYGYVAGDNLLQSIVVWVNYYLRGNATLYRIKGDDFAVLLDCSSESEAWEIANTIFSRFESPWLVDMSEISQRIYTKLNMGIVVSATPLTSHDDISELTERVLSFARKTSRPIFYNYDMDVEYQSKMRLMVSLKTCVLNDMEGFSLNYQPIVNANTGKWVGIEALCRWTSPNVGVVPPDVFIQEAERLGIIDPIGNWVFEEAVSQVRLWGLEKIPGFKLSVNLSPVQLLDKELLPRLTEILDRHSYPREKLCLEITETAEVQFNEITMSILRTIRESGISLSLDDFGSGYSTFSSLKNIPVNILKIDRSFITDIVHDEYTQHTIRIMIDLAHSVGLYVTAEGVETEEQWRILQQDDVESIQGYFFSKPLCKDDLEANLENFKK